MTPSQAKRRALAALGVAREHGAITVCRDVAGRVHVLAGQDLETVGTYTATAKAEDLAEDLVFVTSTTGSKATPEG
ncbi:MAG: hypothetical protein JJU06_13090 [Ectothiorhodospiraceae bacterium]|nr:hypothetical protein [Ectothiorhodospiraceae bacterium]